MRIKTFLGNVFFLWALNLDLRITCHCRIASSRDSVSKLSWSLSSQSNCGNYWFDFDFTITVTQHHQTWPLEVKSGQKISLTFESFDLEDHYSCSFDYVQISFGSFEKKYCGDDKPSPIVSSGNTMRVTFHSDSDSGADNGNGFKATWKSVGTGKFFGKYWLNLW